MAVPQWGQQVLCVRFQVFGMFLCDLTSHVKSNLYQLNKKMCLIDGAEDRSPHLLGLENGVGGEDMHICTLLVPGCLVALEVIELFPVLTTTDISAGHD